MEVARGRLQHRSQHAAVEGRGVPAGLHALHRLHVLQEDAAPEFRVRLPQRRASDARRRLRVEIADADALHRRLPPARQQHDAVPVVGVQGVEQVRIDRDVFRPCRPVVRQARRARESAVHRRQRRGVDQADLPGVTVGAGDQLVVLDPGIAVEPRMDGGQMIALEIVLHRQLPVAADLQFEGGILGAGVKALPGEIGPARRQRSQRLVQIRRRAGKIGEDDAEAHRGPHLGQTELVRPDRVVPPDADAAHMGRRVQPPVQPVAPGVIGAADHRAGPAGMADQLQAPVAADVVEDAHPVVAAAHHQQGQVGNVDRHHRAALRHIALEADGDPAALPDGAALRRLEAGIHIGGIGQRRGEVEGFGDPLQVSGESGRHGRRGRGGIHGVHPAAALLSEAACARPRVPHRRIPAADISSATARTETRAGRPTPPQRRSSRRGRRCGPCRPAPVPS